MTAAANWVTGSGLRYPRAYRPNRAGRQCWANFAIEAWKSPDEPPEKLCLYYSNPKSFVNFLLPDREFGEGWGGVKNLRLLQGLLYCTVPEIKGNTVKFIRVSVSTSVFFPYFSSTFTVADIPGAIRDS